MEREESIKPNPEENQHLREKEKRRREEEDRRVASEIGGELEKYDPMEAKHIE